MNKEGIEKIALGVLLGCFLSILAFIAIDIYTDHAINEITSRDYKTQNETNGMYYNYWAGHEIVYVHDPLSLKYQNETKNINNIKYTNGEEILELEYDNSISMNNLSFQGYALQLKIIPDNFTQKYYAYNHTETNHNENIIIGEPEYQEVTTQCLNLYLNISNCEALKKLII